MTEEIGPEWIPLTHWSRNFKYPSQGTMRNIASNRKTNGADDFIRMVNHRCYINIKKFNEWVEKQKQ